MKREPQERDYHKGGRVLTPIRLDVAIWIVVEADAKRCNMTLSNYLSNVVRQHALRVDLGGAIREAALEPEKQRV